MNFFWWILLIVLFSLPSLLGKKGKQRSRRAKHVFSEENTSEDDDITDFQEAMEELKRHFTGQRNASVQQDYSTNQEEKQFLYEEYNANAPQQPEAELRKQEPEVLQSEPETTDTVNFNLREAVIQSVILHNPYN